MFKKKKPSLFKESHPRLLASKRSLLRFAFLTDVDDDDANLNEFRPKFWSILLRYDAVQICDSGTIKEFEVHLMNNSYSSENFKNKS